MLVPQKYVRVFVSSYCVIFVSQILDECGKGLRTLTDTEFTLASAAVSINSQSVEIRRDAI